MKNRLHNKKAGIAILVTLIIIALAEIAFRLTINHETLLDIASYNLGEQLTVIALAAIILFFNAKGNDKVCYICYAAWIGYFVIDQMFQLPKVLLDVIPFTSEGLATSVLVPTFYLVSAICIIALGGLLLEYMNDGTIYNRAFNGLSLAAILAILVCVVVNVAVVINGAEIVVLLSSIHNMYRLTMVFMLTFFAYDSAKMQKNKVKISK